MPFFLFKSILGVVFFIAASISLITMFIQMGKTDKKANPKTLKIIHKTAGFVFMLLLIIISYFCLKYWGMAGDQISARASLHGILAFTLIGVFLIKISIAQFFKQFLKFMPALGIVVFTLVFVVTASSAGFYFLKMCSDRNVEQQIEITAVEKTKSNAINGQAIFVEKCSGCHYTDREKFKNGPGLKALFQKESLPSSGKPVTIENVKEQLLRPYMVMPSFINLPAQDIVNLLEYLQTL